MLLYYADEAKLYVPVERLDLVQRYSSAEGHQPRWTNWRHRLAKD
jgi:transcription-repair coupling factor (superfamily II helicase)